MAQFRPAIRTSRTQAKAFAYPRWPYAVNWNDPLTEGLLCAVTFDERSGDQRQKVKNLVTGLDNTSKPNSLNIRIRGEEFGNTWSGKENSQNGVPVWDANNFDWIDANGHCIAFLYKAVTDANSVINTTSSGTSNSDRIIPSMWGDGNLYWDYGSTGARTNVSVTAYQGTNKFHHYLLWAEGQSGNGEGMGIQVDGDVLVTDTDTGNPATTTGLSIGGAPSGGNINRELIAGFFIWHHSKDAAFRYKIYDPATRWNIFWELGRRSYFWIPAAGAPTATPKGPLGHPIHGPLAGPVGP